MATKFHPIGDNVVVRREKKTRDGNIDLPENMHEFSMYGEVVAVGPGQLRALPRHSEPTLSGLVLGDPDRLPMQVKVGDIVLLPMHMTMIHADPLHPDPKEPLFYCREGQLIAVLTEEPKE